MISIEDIADYVAIDPSSRSHLRWVKDYGRRIRSGDPAFNTFSGRLGYFQGQLAGKKYMAHRVVFFIANGRWPEKFLDHIDGNFRNNHPDNLREVTHSQNLQNMKRAKGFHKTRNGKFRSRIKDSESGRYVDLGLFDNEEDAHEAYLKAKRKLHPFYVE